MQPAPESLSFATAKESLGKESFSLCEKKPFSLMEKSLGKKVSLREKDCFAITKIGATGGSGFKSL